jgi:hypothetical protein
MKFILFYSSQECPTSINIVNYMRNNNILQMFYKYDVWDFELDQLVSLHIKIIPSIVIISPNGYNEKHEGKQSFIWLQQFINNNKRRNMSYLADSNRHKYLEMELQAGRNGAHDFCKDEMEGMSDGYAYLLTDIPQSKSFVSLGMNEQAILTYENENKLNKNDTEQLLNQNLKIRDNEKELIKNEMKEKQLEAVYNAKIGQ